MALNEFEGTVMLVSHDRDLLRAVCDEFWLVSKGGIAPFDGDLDDYQQFLLDESKRLKSVAQAEAAQQAKATVSSAKMAIKTPPRSGLQKQQVQIESDMQIASNEIAQLQLALTCATQPTELADLGRQLKKAEDRLTKLEAQWLELLEQLEQV
jgi:ATP-binding cassette subfamily F protein 3